MAVWRGEVGIVSATYTLPDPASPGAGVPPDASYGFVCGDSFYGYYINISVIRHSFGGGPTFEYYTRAVVSVSNNVSSDPFDPTAGTVYFTQTNFAANGEGGSGYRDGVTLAIEKDESGDVVRFFTPLGTVTASLSGNGIVGGGQMRPKGIGIGMNLRTPFSTDQDNQVFFADFWGSQDSVRYMGAAMSILQPGTWGAWSRTFGGSGTPHDTTFTQETADEKAEQSAVSTTVYGVLRDSFFRAWAGGDAITATVREIDLTWAPEHGVLWAAYTLSAHPEKLYLQTSYDDGRTWHAGTVYEKRGQSVSGPNIMWWKDRLIAVWHDGRVIVQSTSRDYGTSWSTPLSVIGAAEGAATLSYPRAVIHPEHGIIFYFYTNTGGDLVMRRSGVFGAAFTDVAEILVLAGAGNQRIDASISGDGRLRVRFITLGLEAAFYSVDYGFTWNNYISGAVVDTRPQQVYDKRSGLSYHVRYDTFGTALRAYPSADYGATIANGILGTVEAVAVEQNADIENLPGGGQIVAYFTGAEVFTTKRSQDYAVSWA